MTRWYQSEAVSVVLAVGYFAAFLAVLVAASGCTAEGLTVTVSPEDADAHPELVELLTEASGDWTAAGYTGELRVVVSPTDYGPRWRVDPELVPCNGKPAWACTRLRDNVMSVTVWAGAAADLATVSHEMGHLLGAEHLSDVGALMYSDPTKARPTAADVEATR